MREAHAAGGHLRAHQGRDSGAAGTMGEGRRGSVSCGHFRHSRIQGLARLNVSSSDAASDSSIREGWRRAALSASAPAAQDSLTSMLGQCVNQTHLAEPVRQRGPAIRLRAPSAVFAHPILQLQKTIGNQAVQDLLRSCAIQAKLAISQPGDPYEDEADRIAGQVMRMPDMPIQRTCSEGASGASTCSACERKEQVAVRRGRIKVPLVPVRSPTTSCATLVRANLSIARPGCILNPVFTGILETCACTPDRARQRWPGKSTPGLSPPGRT